MWRDRQRYNITVSGKTLRTGQNLLGRTDVCSLRSSNRRWLYAWTIFDRAIFCLALRVSADVSPHSAAEICPGRRGDRSV